MRIEHHASLGALEPIQLRIGGCLSIELKSDSCSRVKTPQNLTKHKAFLTAGRNFFNKRVAFGLTQKKLTIQKSDKSQA
jgi:hypothetical protein